VSGREAGISERTVLLFLRAGVAEVGLQMRGDAAGLFFRRVVGGIEVVFGCGRGEGSVSRSCFACFPPGEEGKDDDDGPGS